MSYEELEMMEAAQIRNMAAEAEINARANQKFLQPSLAQTKEGFEEAKKVSRRLHDDIEEDLKFDLLERRIDHGK